MSTNNSTETPSWAVDTETDDGIIIYHGTLHEHEGITAQIVDSVPTDEGPRPDLAVRFEANGSQEYFYLPMTRLDDLIALLTRVRGTVAIRPDTGEVVGLR